MVRSNKRQIQQALKNTIVIIRQTKKKKQKVFRFLAIRRRNLSQKSLFDIISEAFPYDSLSVHLYTTLP